MAMRVTGMMSGLDTESIIQQLVAARQTKVDTLKKKQTTHQWKQDAWKELNSKIYKLYSGTLSNLQYAASFSKKTTTVSNSNLVSVITSDNAMNSVQNLKITNLAKAGYLTGAKVTGKDDKALSSSSKVVENLGIETGSKFEISAKGKKTEITIDENTTINSLVNQLKSAGVNANFDAGQQRFYIGAGETGTQSDFSITAANSAGTDALDKLGILVYDDKTINAYQEYAEMSDEDRQKLIDSRVEARRAKYVSDRDALVKKNEELDKKVQDLLKDFNENYSSPVVMTDDVDRGARKTYINDKIKEMTADGVVLNEDQKRELDQLKGELSYIEGYEKLQKSIDDNDTKITSIDKYVDNDGNAKSDLVDEVTTQVNEKIDTAKNIYRSYEAWKDYEEGDSEPAEPRLAGSDGAHKEAGADCVIELNGVQYTSSSNSIEVNGLTITCNGKTAPGEEITLTTQNDTSGIYDMIKSFIKEYSALINEMDKLYNAESAKGYEPLTDEEKEAMSESDIEKWESKIKDSLFRRDSTVSSVSGAMKEIMASGFEVNGRKMYLYDFGIETLGYFNAAENEKSAYHIHGDEDDEAVRNETNKLMAMISSDPDTVVSFFTQLSQKLYGKMFDLMKGTDFSSVYKVYDDKKMKEEYDEYTKKIAEEEKKLQAYEDKWYKKFSAMETAMAKMQSNASAITSLLGGS